MISMIAVVSENRMIGKGNKLLWDLPEDMERFRRITKGHPVIMGRKTFESIGRLLPNRVNIIITRDKEYKVEGAFVVYSLEEAIDLAKTQTGSDEIFIIGGSQIYRQGIKFADKLYLTVVHAQADGDADFPDYSEFKKVVFSKDSQEKDLKYTFTELEK